MGVLGFILTTAGFLAGAFLTSLDHETVRWGLFVPAMAVGLLGVYLLKSAGRAHARSDEVLASNRLDLEQSLAAITENLEVLEQGKDRIPPYELRFEIDRRFREDITRFVEARATISHIYGLQTYADIMSAFAAGERYLNRVWSASADGYVDEAREYIARALEQFREAREKLQTATRRAAPARSPGT